MAECHVIGKLPIHVNFIFVYSWKKNSKNPQLSQKDVLSIPSLQKVSLN